jgi:hypothetical protein
MGLYPGAESIALAALPTPLIAPTQGHGYGLSLPRQIELMPLSYDNLLQLCIRFVTVAIPNRSKTVQNPQAVERASTAANVTVNRHRPRQYLTEREIEKLMNAARNNRWGHRDATAILIAYRHGLRAGELVAPCAAPGECTCVGPRAGLPACIQSEPRKAEHCEGYSGK